MAQVFRHGNAEVTVVIEDGVCHFNTKLLTHSPVFRLHPNDNDDVIERMVHVALDEDTDAYVQDTRAALKAAFDWAEDRFGIGQLT